MKQLVLLIIGLLLVPIVFAGVPNNSSVQVILLNATTNEVINGTRNIAYNLSDSSGVNIWNELIETIVDYGRASNILGTITALTSSLFINRHPTLSITVDDGETQTLPITTTFYAFVADYAYNAATRTYYFNITPDTYDGNLSPHCSKSGYECGDFICNNNFTGTHLCQQYEIIQTIQDKNVSAIAEWSSQVWVSSGGPKYAPATVPANDCNGFTDGTTSYLGSYWNLDQDGGGDGRMINCGTSIALACCKNW